MTLPKPKPKIDEKSKDGMASRIRSEFSKGGTPRDVCRLFNADVVEQIIIEAVFGEGIAKSKAVDMWMKIAEIDKIKGAKAPLKIVPVTLEAARARELVKAQERQRKFTAQG